MAAPTMIRPQQIDNLPLLDATQKQHYRTGLAGLWQQYESAPDGSPQKADVRQRIITASTRIMHQITSKTRPANNQPRPVNPQTPLNGGTANAQAQQSQNPQQLSQQRAQQAQQQAQQQVQQQQLQQNPQHTNDPDTVIKNRLTLEINQLVVAPPENCASQQQFELYKRNFKSSLGNYRFKAEKSRYDGEIIQRQIQQMQQMGQQPSDEMHQKLTTYRNATNTFSQQAQSLMESNNRNLEAAQARKSQNRPDQPSRPPTQPGIVNQQQQQQDTASPIQPPPRPATGQGQQSRPVPQAAPVQQPQRPGQPSQQYPQQYPSAPNSAAPQSANPAQRPHALSQQGAIAKAQEQNNLQNATPQPAGQGNMPYNNTPMQGTPTSAMPQTSSAMNAKFPIPKSLNLGPQAQTPVNGAPARPTNMSHGMMSAPGVQKAPQFTLEGEGDHVMSSRKLNEIVRQITGTADPADGLSPEVEEAVLSLTDNFVDDVITRACQLAKLRQGSTLDIRDVQLVLERNYGLRIPGYSLDETRTVRKFNPSPNWVAKVQSVQASKLTRGE